MYYCELCDGRVDDEGKVLGVCALSRVYGCVEFCVYQLDHNGRGSVWRYLGRVFVFNGRAEQVEPHLSSPSVSPVGSI